MKAEDLKTKTPDELTKLLLDARKEQMNMRFQRSSGQLENTAQIRNVRRKIAKIKTFLTVNAAPAKAQKAKAKAEVKASKATPKKKAPAKKPAAKKSGEKAA